ncbi:TIGR01777 family oxidoreductase [Buchananella hordeovulneris]|uniref:TIGR01777 family protein n=1 Tax=Buchananella hordeovulneris TaxID=52770 RepID=A0A1Q5PXH3_9ACTO|nr:TIGR01777 family oxidoreductase [Buchananella hordeovulneris]OKL52135.1 TIGR01777 family protein [Buchananella hordeovulneris]
MQRIGITGASGLIGTAVRQALQARGDEPVALGCRRDWQPDDLATLDAVINLGGASLGGRRWNAAYKRQIRDSRVLNTASLAGAIARSDRPIRLVSASAVGFYGDRGETVLGESAAAGEGFLADVCRAWEAAAADAVPTAALVRTGIVVSGRGGALARLAPLARWGLAGPLGSGRQFWPWIALADHVRALLHLLDRPELTGPFNLVAPQPVRQRDFARALGRAVRRPTVLPTPGWALRLAAGEFGGELLASQRAVPTALAGSGFTFAHPELGPVLAACVRRRARAAGKD